MSVDKWLSKKYIDNLYTCSDFTREVWLDITNVDIGPALQGLLQAHDGRGLCRDHVQRFRQLPGPRDPCLIVMQRPRWPVHIAVYLRKKVLQITERGVEFQPIEVATRFHKSFRFIECRV